MTDYLQTDRTTVKRLPERGSHDRATVYEILDEALICHVGFNVDDQPYVIPTIHARDGDRLYLHGSPASRMLRTDGGGIRVCVTTTLVDGLVLARSAFHHSMNYRSAMVLGTAQRVEDRPAKLAAMELLTDRVMPGRWADTRGPNDIEFNGTLVLELSVEEASAKVRTGPPGDDDADLELPYWAGVVPLDLGIGAPEPAPDLADGIPVPAYVRWYRRS